MISNHENFIGWAKENYSGMEYEDVLNHYAQSGEYPDMFLDECSDPTGDLDFDYPYFDQARFDELTNDDFVPLDEDIPF